MMSRRRFSKEVKLTAVRRIQAGEAGGRLARELEINPSDRYRWCREREEFGVQAFAGSGRQRREPERVAELERKLGQQALEIDF